jgi:hypothetical protein
MGFWLWPGIAPRLAPATRSTLDTSGVKDFGSVDQVTRIKLASDYV